MLKACLEPLIYRLRKPYFESKTESEARASGWEPWAVRTGKSFRPDASSGQSNIWVKRYDQNTGGSPDGLTERPDGKLQPPFKSSTESFHNKAASGRCFPSVRTVALRLHEITIIRLGASGPWRLTSWRLNWCTQFPYMKLDRSDHEDCRPDGLTLYARLAF